MTLIQEFIDGGPDCSRDDCMISELNNTQTLAHYISMYNKDGVIIKKPDNNIITVNKRCFSCGKGWTETWQNGIKISTL